MIEGVSVRAARAFFWLRGGDLPPPPPKRASRKHCVDPKDIYHVYRTRIQINPLTTGAAYI